VTNNGAGGRAASAWRRAQGLGRVVLATAHSSGRLVRNRASGLVPGWTARDLLTSLSVRIVAVTLIWAAVALPIVAITLNSIYRDRIQREFDVRLDQLTTLLIASSTLQEASPPQPPGDFGEVLFSLAIANGWYWQIEPARPGPRAPRWPITSRSLLGEQLDTAAFVRAARAQSGGQISSGTASDAASEPSGPPDVSGADQLTVFNADLPDGQRLRVSQLVVPVNDGAGSVRPYRFTVTGNRDEVDRTVASFAGKLTLSLLVLALALLLLPMALVWFGLRPLKRIQSGLSRIRLGDRNRLEVDLPIEVRPLQVELNGLLDANTAIVERARTHVGNLAHALKTPVSVMMNAAQQGDPQLSKLVFEQTGIMRDQVDHHLNRARTAARVKVLGVETPVQPVIGGLARTLDKLFPAISVTAERVDDGLIFLGERQDFEEILGNLMENACKWSDRRVNVRAHLLDMRDGERGATGFAARMAIDVEDDGPGLTPQEAQAALKRGQRLDETTPGTGLGLAIVADTVALYGGTLELLRSPLGGLHARMVLPARALSAHRRGVSTT